MNQTQLLKFLTKFEPYLKGIHQIITPDNWNYYKEHGSLPSLAKEEELQTKLLKSGFNKDLILSDINNGTLTKQDAYELFDNIFTPSELNELADEQAGKNLVNQADLVLAESLIDYLDEKGLNS